MAKKIVKEVSDAPAVAETTTVETTDVKVQSADAVVTDKFEQLNQKVNDLTSALRDLQVHLKSVQKDLVKLVKTNVKKSKSRASTGAKKTPSGFAKPTKLSNGLCDFLGVPHDTELARTDVTRRINAYIKEQNLQDERDRRIIHPDAKLSAVLTRTEDKPLSFFNLQSALRSNFVKTVAA
jgi:chromatin remodeling complex protein RSC6